MKKQGSNAKIKIIPLGGMEQIGMNITAFEYRGGLRTCFPQRRHAGY